MSEFDKFEWENHLNECYKIIEQMQITDYFIKGKYTGKFIRD